MDKGHYRGSDYEKSPSVLLAHIAPVAQMDRVSDYGSEG